MVQVIKNFFLFNFLGRLLGIIIDLVLVYFSSELYAKSYYLLSSIPVLIYSLSGYLSSISKISSWASSVLLKLRITTLFVFGYCLTSFFITTKTNLDSFYGFVITLIVISFFSGVVTNLKAVNNEHTIWLFPAAGFVSLCIGLIGALTFKGGLYEPFLVVIIMTIIRPVLFLFKGKAIEENFEIPDIKFFSVVALAFCGLRHLILVLYRFYVSDDLIIEYSFNSRIIQNFYAFSLIPLLIHLSNFKGKETRLFRNIFLGILSSIFISVVLMVCFDGFEYMKIHFSWLLVMIIMGLAILCSDYFLISLGNKFPMKVISSQIIVSVFILIINYFYWGLQL
jgi:hypothetical protein